MTTAEIKELVRSRSKREVCEVLHDVMIAADADAMLTAGIPMLEYGYRMGIIDDDLFDEVDPDLALTEGVYVTGDHTITDPEETIFFFRTTTATINITDVRSKVVCLGTGAIIINVSGDGYVNLVCHAGANVTLNLSGNAIAFIDTKGDASLTVVSEGASIAQINGSGSSEIEYEGSDTTHAQVKMFQQSSFTYLLNDTATVEAVAENNATVTETLV